MVTLKAHILPHHDLQPPGCRGSFEASWKTMQDMCSDSISHLVDDADFMSAFIRITINHVCHNYDKLTAQEGHHGNIEEVNYEEVAERLVRNAWVFC
ncbi:TPA: hypothetical protein H7B05_004314 [Escherichia coli 042]|nr:hypothetical protein [Escherichia coli 042]